VSEGRVAGKVALVSGGAKGIGAACARRFAEEGARVAIGDIDVPEGEHLVAELTNKGLEAMFVELDVASEDAWVGAIEAVCARFGDLNILVNNAGIAMLDSLSEITADQWRHIHSINVDGVFFGTKHAVPAMAASGGGSIINMSSVLGLVGEATMIAYSTTKGAVRNFTKAAALECGAAGNGVRVNSVHPAYIRTPMVEAYAELLGTREEGLAILGARHPLGRIGEVEDVANGVLYLASDESSFVTGAELVIDGGFTAT